MARRSFYDNDMFSLIIAVVILIIIIVILYYFDGKSILETFTSEKRYNLEYYYMDGCSHCVNFNKTGIFEDLKKKYEHKCEFNKYNNDNRDRIEKYNISGFPTIIITQNNKLVAEYDGNREKDDLEKFIKLYI